MIEAGYQVSFQAVCLHCSKILSEPQKYTWNALTPSVQWYAAASCDCELAAAVPTPHVRIMVSLIPISAAE